MAEFAGYSRAEPDIHIHLFTGEEQGFLVARCGARIAKTDLIDAEGLGDDEPLSGDNPHLCPVCLPALREWAKANLSEE